MKKLAFGLLLLSTLAAKAQDLIVHYDFIHDKFTYEQKGKIVSKPTVRKNNEVRVMVENLNPFVFIARCDWKEETVEDNSSMSGIAGMFSGLSAGSEALSGLLSGLNMDQFNLASARSDISMFEKFGAAKSDMKNAINSYNKLFMVEQALLNSDFTTAKLKKLKFNPYLPSDTLKRITNVLVENALNYSHATDFSITATTFLHKANDLSNTLNVEYNNLLLSAQNFLDAYNTFSSMNGTNFSEAGMDRTIKSMMSVAAMLKDRYTSDDIHHKIEALEQQYETIIYTPFVYVCNYLAQSDRLTLTLDIFETSPYTRASDVYVSGGDAVDTLRKIRTKTLHVLVEGDMKISTSVGLGFPTYFDKNQNFSNRDSIITSTAGNNFSPCISTFVNFYPYAGKNVHWGGCFGVGIPVQSEGMSNLNFFLGGSAVLGSTSKVGLHAGLAIGQMTSLANGQRLGDNLGDEFTIPETKKAFTTGAFFAISFALGQ